MSKCRGRDISSSYRKIRLTDVRVIGLTTVYIYTRICLWRVISYTLIFSLSSSLHYNLWRSDSILNRFHTICLEIERALSNRVVLCRLHDNVCGFLLHLLDLYQNTASHITLVGILQEQSTSDNHRHQVSGKLVVNIHENTH